MYTFSDTLFTNCKIDTANVFMISKSTAHTDMTVRLPQVDPEKYEKVREVLDTNII